jgi:hypothetical protein
MKTVYWGNFCREDALSRMKLLNQAPEKVMPELRKKMIVGERQLVLCPASNDFFQNTYMLKFPKDFEIHFDADGTVLNDSENFFLSRVNQFQNRIAVELDLSWIFYSEESVTLEVMPPFYHNTTFQKFGTIMCGKFDINSWFRPIQLSFALWEGVRTFTVKENDPVCYLRFLDTDTIKLQEFNVNTRLVEIAQTCVSHPTYYKRQIPLVKRYEKFKQSGLNKMIEEEIKGNLVI